MDAIELLKADHRKVEGLFSKYEKAGDNAHKTKQGLVEEITKELEVHTTLEEEMFYPEVEERAKKDGQELVHEGFEEHHVVKVLLGELAAMQPEDEQYDAKVTVLIENVKHHVEEEETELLPKAEKALGKERIQQLGAQMAQRKKVLERA